MAQHVGVRLDAEIGCDCRPLDLIDCFRRALSQRRTALPHPSASLNRDAAARVRLFSQRSICRRACAEPLSAARRFAKRFWIRSALAFAFLTAMRAWLNSVRARPAGVWSNLRERSRLCDRRVSGDRLRAAIEGDDEPAGRRDLA
jgi:hypothetical protein